MSNFSLYEINDLLRQALDKANEYAEADEGIIPDDWSKFLDEVQMERDTKALDVGRYIKSLEAEAEAVKGEKMRLSARQSALQNHADRLRGYVAGILKPGEAIKDANTALGWRRSTQVEIVDLSAIPEAYIKIERFAQKGEIKAALKCGDVPGARLVDHQNLQIK
jgi:hypothetical protein